MASAREDFEYRLAASGATDEPAMMRIGFWIIGGVRIRYAESKGPPERTIVLASAWPDSVFAFAPIWTSLARRFRQFAVDLPGFGASERREAR
ncbi:MAG: hypothetical protein WBP81_19725 [Solirubrobacteraceae bacterium]